MHELQTGLMQKRYILRAKPNCGFIGNPCSGHFDEGQNGVTPVHCTIGAPRTQPEVAFYLNLTKLKQLIIKIRTIISVSYKAPVSV